MDTEELRKHTFMRTNGNSEFYYVNNKAASSSDDEEDQNNEKDNNYDDSDPKGDNSITTRGAHHTIHTLVISGQIEGHYALSSQTKSTKYEKVIPQLVGVEEDSAIDGLLIILNTIGGDVEAGLAIAELIRGIKKPTVSLVLGGGHSIGVPLAVSAKTSFIVPSATMTLHPVRFNGLVIGAEQSFEHFMKMQDRILDFTVKNSRVKRETLLNLMNATGEMATDIGTIVDGKRAVEIGLIDKIGSLDKAMTELKNKIKKYKESNRT